MRAKTARGKLSTRKYAPPSTTDPDKARQQWNQSNTEARALAARERAKARALAARERAKARGARASKV